MKIDQIATGSLLAGLLLLNGQALAEAVYVDQGKILLADEDLMIFDVSDPGTPLHTVTIGGATDVAVADCQAVVTSTVDGIKSLTVIDLNDHLEHLGGEFCSSSTSACGEVTYEPNESVLTIPCVDALGATYTLEMKQRGNSDNWYIQFLEEVEE